MSEQSILSDLKQKIESLKRDIALKEGEANSTTERMKKDFNVDSLDEAYTLLKKLSEDIEAKKERREELIKIAQEKLAGYKR